ncbi:MAG: hypothetical protein F4Y40_01385 [Acidimicrobiia bacterium]|nr:hypothetical protein [Acidimicrobiia bacterium]
MAAAVAASLLRRSASASIHPSPADGAVPPSPDLVPPSPEGSGPGSTAGAAVVYAVPAGVATLSELSELQAPARRVTTASSTIRVRVGAGVVFMFLVTTPARSKVPGSSDSPKSALWLQRLAVIL